MFFQIWTMMTAASAHLVLDSQPGSISAGTPRKRRNSLIGPPSFRNMALNTAPTATMDATYGKKMAERKKFTNLILEFSRIASPNEAAILNTTVNRLNTSVCDSEARNTRSLKMAAKFFSPTNSIAVKPSHFIRLSTKENATGIRIKTAKPIKFGKMKDMPTSVLRVFSDMVRFLGVAFAADGTGISSLPEKRHKKGAGGLRPPRIRNGCLD